MAATISQVLSHCPTFQKNKKRDQPAPCPLSTLKGKRPFQGYHIDLIGPFVTDQEGNRYFFVAQDPFSKWVKAYLLPDKYSWRTARCLWQLIACWGRPSWITTDNRSEFMGFFTSMVKSIDIKHRHITVGNSQANGQVKRANRTLKEVIQRMLTQYPESEWSDHVPTALMLMRFTPQKTLQILPFTLVTRCAVLTPQHVLDDVELDYDAVPLGDLEQYISQQLARLSATKSFVHRQLKTTGTIEPSMETLFQFKPGNLVLRKTRVLGKLAPKRDGPYRVVRVSGR